MALDMNGATYGRNKAKINDLAGSYEASITSLKKALYGNDGGPDTYSALMKTIDNYWVGADADQFKSDVSKKRDEISKKLDNYQNKVREALNSSYEEFIKFQSNNK